MGGRADPHEPGPEAQETPSVQQVRGRLVLQLPGDRNSSPGESSHAGFELFVAHNTLSVLFCILLARFGNGDVLRRKLIVILAKLRECLNNLSPLLRREFLAFVISSLLKTSILTLVLTVGFSPFACQSIVCRHTVRLIYRTRSTATPADSSRSSSALNSSAAFSDTTIRCNGVPSAPSCGWRARITSSIGCVAVFNAARFATAALATLMLRMLGHTAAVSDFRN